MSDDSVRLSLLLCKVLERIGVSESMRKMHRDASICRGIQGTITAKMIDSNISTYIFGSTCEGTKTPGMGSDVDVVVCNEKPPVIEHIRDAPPGDPTYLMVTYRHTRPGYVKLQLVYDGTPVTIHNYSIDDSNVQYDCEGRVCLKHIINDDLKFNEMNGPAHTISNNPNFLPQDRVIAFRCKSFPHIAEESLEKCITCCLVSRDEVEKMKRFGILLVGVGHESSPERDIEFRISFSHQERHLMLALNPTQHKCYVTLKIIKHLITAHEDVKKSITSYHCKTCLLTVITQTGMEIWTDENLIKCIFICLSTLKRWVYRGNCSNFFIQENNMFERREFRQVRERLLHYMREILNEGPSLFYRINCARIGEAIRGLDPALRQIDDNRTKQMYDVLVDACRCPCICQRIILDHCHKRQSSQCVTRYLFQQLRYLSSIDTITEHSHEDTRIAVQQMKPVLHKLFAQQLASEAFHTEDPASRYRLLEDSDRHLRRGMNGDVMSCRLLEATIVYRKGNLESCCGLLEQIERRIMHGAVMSQCYCCRQAEFRHDYLKRQVSLGNIHQHNIMESSVAMCMMFLSSHSEIIPKALQYEIYRSVGTSPGSRHKDWDKWFDWAAVDSKIYLFYMQYLVYSGLNKPVGKRIAAMNHINQTLLNDKNLGHRETAYNLLGWMFLQEGKIPAAAEMFCRSWQIRPDHNAAKWHLGVLYWRLTSQ